MFALSAQQKGVTPLTPYSALPTPHSTWAVVIGISDYQDKDIPDLRFADRNAEAFYPFYISLSRLVKLHNQDYPILMGGDK